ncbi:MAG TPA: hypothetical protein VNU24_03395 [Solirubrobacteraceae bacterium]|jgi:hypothetical protein|nr:hypothetical protein [Solirubrobacteraceae bacterium]
MTDIPSASNVEDDQQDEQQRIARLVRSFDAPAPQSLHRRIELLVDGNRDFRRRSWPLGHLLASPVLAGAGAIVVVVAVAIAIAVGSGGSGGGTSALSVGQAVAPTLSAATLPAPRESLAHNAQLEATVDGVPFPYWGERFGWHSTGARAERIKGHVVKTVFYANSGGQRVGYAIFAGAQQPGADGVVAWRGGVAYRLFDEHGVAVVMWMRDGHLCVVSGRRVSRATLLRLASWGKGNPTVA